MKLYSYFNSSAAYRVRIALHHKSIKFDTHAIDLLAKEHRSSDFLRVNPHGLIPALELDDGQVLTQTLAILEWLDEAYPQQPLFPANLVEKANIRALCDLIACEIHPICVLKVQNYVSDTLDQGDEGKAQWLSHWISDGFQVLEQKVSAEPFCYGNTLTMADIFLVPQFYNAIRFGVDVSPFQKLQKIYDHCTSLSAFQKAAPLAQPDAPPQA